MKKKRLRKVALQLLLISAFGLMLLRPMPVSAQPMEVVKEGVVSIVPFADIIEWRYKMENGILYRRLYNLTKGFWIGEWEPMF